MGKRIAGHEFDSLGYCTEARADGTVCNIRLRWLIEQCRDNKDVINQSGYAHMSYLTQTEYYQVLQADADERLAIARSMAIVGGKSHDGKCSTIC